MRKVKAFGKSSEKGGLLGKIDGCWTFFSRGVFDENKHVPVCSICLPLMISLSLIDHGKLKKMGLPEGDVHHL